MLGGAGSPQKPKARSAPAPAPAALKRKDAEPPSRPAAKAARVSGASSRAPRPAGPPPPELSSIRTNVLQKLTGGVKKAAKKAVGSGVLPAVPENVEATVAAIEAGDPRAVWDRGLVSK